MPMIPCMSQCSASVASKNASKIISLPEEIFTSTPSLGAEGDSIVFAVRQLLTVERTEILTLWVEREKEPLKGCSPDRILLKVPSY